MLCSIQHKHANITVTMIDSLLPGRFIGPFMKLTLHVLWKFMSWCMFIFIQKDDSFIKNTSKVTLIKDFTTFICDDGIRSWIGYLCSRWSWRYCLLSLSISGIQLRFQGLSKIYTWSKSLFIKPGKNNLFLENGNETLSLNHASHAMACTRDISSQLQHLKPIEILITTVWS